MSRFLQIIGAFCYGSYRVVLMGCLALAVLCVLGASQTLTVDTDWLVLFSDKHSQIRELRKWRELLPGSKDVAIIVSEGTLSARREAVEATGKLLRSETSLLEHPLISLESEPFLQSGLYFLKDESLKRLESQCGRAKTLSQLLDGREKLHYPNLIRRLKGSHEGRRTLAQTLELVLAVSDPESSREALEQAFERPKFESPKLQEVLGGDTEIPSKLYLSLDGEETILALVRPILPNGRKEAAGPAVERLREITEELRRLYPDLKFALTGEPVLIIDEQKTIARDSLVTTVISLTLILLIFRFGFREMLRPILSLVTLLVGLLWTLGAVALTVGHLNFITVTYIPILVGIGIDFAIHITFRYFELRGVYPGPKAIETTMLTAGWDTTLGVVTTAAAFSSLILVGFRGVAELGTIAILGVSLCQISSCTFLPALLGLLEASGIQITAQGRQDLEGCHASVLPWRSGLLCLSLVVSTISVFFAPKAKFDIHLLRMQNPKLESIKTELDLIASGKTSVLTALVPAADLTQAKEFEAALRSLDTVNDVISLSTFLPKVNPEREGLIESILEARPAVLNLLSKLEEAPEVDAQTAMEILEELGHISGQDASAKSIRQFTAALLHRVENRGPGPIVDSIETLMNRSSHETSQLKELFRRQSTQTLTRDQLPAALTSRLYTSDQRYCLKVFPKQDIWQPDKLDDFLSDLHSVSASVSGEPVLIDLFERLVLITHWRGLALSLLFISGVLVVVMRSLKLALLASLPTLFSVLNLLGIMGYFGWVFNPANFVAIPMLLGIGSVFGLHSVLRMRDLGDDRLLCCSTGPAILLSAATSAAGFASLTVAAHLGIASLGALVSLGLSLNAFVSLILLPALVSRWPRLVS